MQGWIVLGSWAFAVLLAVVLLGFAGYEISWKLRRLRADVARLDSDVTALNALAADLQAGAARIRR